MQIGNNFGFGSGTGNSGTVTSVGLVMPTPTNPAFRVSNSPITSRGDLTVIANGDVSQYVRGDGSLASFPSLTGYVPYTGATSNVDLGLFSITATSIIKTGGTSSQFLKANGSVDSSAYITLTSLSFAAGSGAYNNSTGVITIPTNNNQITNGAGYITSSALTGYVPYTGATSNVDLGTFTLLAAQIKATSSGGLSINANSGTQIANLGAGGGANMTLYGGLSGTSATFSSNVTLTATDGTSYIQYAWQSATPTGAASATTMWFDATGRINWRPSTGASSYVRTFDATGIAQNSTWTLPNIASTVLAGLSVTQTFTATQTITPTSLTGSSTGNILVLNQTWNTTGNPTAIKMLITDTAYGSTSKLVDLQTNSRNSVFTVDALGATVVGSGGTTAGLTVKSNSGTDMIIGNSIAKMPATIINNTGSTIGLVCSSNAGTLVTVGTYNNINTGGNTNLVQIGGNPYNATIQSRVGAINNMLLINPTYNLNADTTSAAIQRGIYYSPTITNLGLSAHYSWENTTGDNIFGSTSGNTGIGGLSVGGGSRVLFIANALTVPTSNPTGGGIVYVEGGALKYRGSSGTVTILANA
jgi:hypothetical protein